MDDQNTNRSYLDNAATTFPKPRRVHEAMIRFARSIGASPGRGGYAEAIEAGSIVGRCRERLCRLLDGESPEHVVFTLNATDALNLAIKGIVSARRRARPDEPIHLITTAMDHNSVLRPMNRLAGEPGVEWTCLAADPETGRVDPGSLREALRPETALFATLHASNVSGTIQPIGEFAEICRGAGVPILVDAAQSLGHLPVSVRALGIDLLAFPGHKGLLGPLGTGGLYIRPGLEDRLDPLREGGTGSRSDEDVQPTTLPDKFEPGSGNTLGIAGLNEGVAWLLERGIEAMRAHEVRLMGRMLQGLSLLESTGLRLLGPRAPEDRVGVFSVVHPGLRPYELATVLEHEFGVQARAGIHCAPRAHATFGTVEREGAVRFSFSPFTTEVDVDRLLTALGSVCRASGAGSGLTASP